MRRSAIAVALLLLSSTLPAQNIGPLPPLTAHVDVQVVNVDVTVTDRDGQPVTDLTKADFELFEDGALQKISNFYVVRDSAVGDGASPAAGTPAGDVPAEFRRKVLLIVDNNYIEKTERNIALTKMEKYVTSRFGAEWGLVMVGHAAQIVQPFTTDVAAIHTAFDRAREAPTFYLHREIDRSILSDRTRRQLDLATTYDYNQAVRFSSREQTFRNLLTVTNTARAVAEMARAHSADIGKKYILLLTGGMELNTSFKAYDTAGDRELEQTRLEMVKLIDGMVREVNAANFTIHVVNGRTRGMQAPQHDVENRTSGIRIENLLREGGGNDPIDTTDVDSAPLSLALGTGGMYLPSNDIVASVARIDHQTANFYSLGYSPSSHHGDRQYHAIKVRVKRPGVRVANRVGYYDLTADDRLEEMLRARATFDRSIGALQVKMDVGAAKSRTDHMVVPVRAGLQLDKVTVIPNDKGYVGRVHVYVSVFDRNGKNIGFHHQIQEVTLSPDQLRDAERETFHYTMNVRLQEKGEFTVVVTLRDELSNEMGSASEAVRL